ncbi:hypothetical protein [Rhizobium sp. PP-CC-3G-465]|uniref:hypothetical protein n=1 Tax=Rhizobium sp. PP-CC-3G-465 TaxID=2135648 RepID=UPI00104FE527|nr:hypothetical protein C8J33_11233 [Rhizobium sp. PP-CC-3G-465]
MKIYLLVLLAFGILLSGMIAVFTRPDVLGVSIPMGIMLGPLGQDEALRTVLSRHFTLLLSTGTILSGIAVALRAGPINLRQNA